MRIWWTHHSCVIIFMAYDMNATVYLCVSVVQEDFPEVSVIHTRSVSLKLSAVATMSSAIS